MKTGQDNNHRPEEGAGATGSRPDTHPITAKTSDEKGSATSGRDGGYESPRLLPGIYEITANIWSHDQRSFAGGSSWYHYRAMLAE